MKLTITTTLFLALSAQACSVGEVEELEVEMYGVSSAKDGVSGDRDPSYQWWWLKEVHIVPVEGETISAIYDEEGISYRIVDRPQIIFQQDLSDYLGVEFSKLELVFGSTVLGGNQSITDLSFPLSQTTLTLTGPFTMKKARKLQVVLELAWANSLSEDKLEEPGITLTIP